MTNYVELQGTISGMPVRVSLADGSQMVSWRLKVPRDESGSDSITCFSQVSKVMKYVEKQRENAEICVIGAIRSRYWQAQGLTQTRIDVEVDEVTKA